MFEYKFFKEYIILCTFHRAHTLNGSHIVAYAHNSGAPSARQSTNTQWAKMCVRWMGREEQFRTRPQKTRTRKNVRGNCYYVRFD